VGKVELRKRIHHELSHLKELETTLAFKVGHDSRWRATLTWTHSRPILRARSRVYKDRGVTLAQW
jgi:hypothetical protein